MVWSGPEEYLNAINWRIRIRCEEKNSVVNLFREYCDSLLVVAPAFLVFPPINKYLDFLAARHLPCRPPRPESFFRICEITDERSSFELKDFHSCHNFHYCYSKLEKYNIKFSLIQRIFAYRERRICLFNFPRTFSFSFASIYFAR